LLDRPGGRGLLGKIATLFLGRVGGEGIEIIYLRGMWTRRVGSYFFPESLRFDYAYADFEGWKHQAEKYLTDTRDFWLQHYSPKEGDVIVDVGAGRGEDVLAFSQAVGRSGRVIAIEAHPGSFAILDRFCVLNGLTNVTRLPLALMDKAGTVRISDSESSWMENAIQEAAEVPGTEVRAATFSRVCEEERLEEIAFLKMNIEGAERQALAGMKEVLPRIRQICVACHDFRSDLGHGEQFRTRAFVEEFLLEHGFTLASRPDDPRNYVRDHVFGLRLC
jgi:FkbM family methyltransferase